MDVGRELATGEGKYCAHIFKEALQQSLQLNSKSKIPSEQSPQVHPVLEITKPQTILAKYYCSKPIRKIRN